MKLKKPTKDFFWSTAKAKIMSATGLIIGIGGAIALLFNAIGYEPETPLWTGDKEEIYMTIDSHVSDLRIEITEAKNDILTQLASSDQAHGKTQEEVWTNRIWALQQHLTQTQMLIYMNEDRQQQFRDKQQSIPPNLMLQKAAWEQNMVDWRAEIARLETLLAPTNPTVPSNRR